MAAVMMPAVRRRLLVLGGCALAVGIVIVALVGGGSAHSALARLSPKPPAGFEPLSAPADVNPPAPVKLDTGWEYVADPANLGLRADWAHGGAANLAWRAVSVPNVFNPTVSSASDGGSDGWYRLRFTAPPELAARSWTLHFGEVRRQANVWLNGALVGSSHDGYAPFNLPATSLQPGLNTLVVRVDNRRLPGSFPQDWWNWGGITQPVTLEPVGRVALENLGVMPELACNYRCGDLLVQGTLHNLARVPLRPRLVLDLRSRSGAAINWSKRAPLLAPGASVPISYRVPVTGPLELWAPGHPSLYGLRITTRVQKRAEQVDSLKVGMRSLQVRRGVLYLNGRRLWLHGASIHEDMPGRGAALTSGDVNTIVSELQAVHANVTRAHYLLSQPLLDALDAAGILVWSQPPVDHADALLRTPVGRHRALALLRDTILSARSHPSVVIQSVGNELSPTPDTTPGTRSYLKQAIPVVRRLDPAAEVALDTYCYPGFAAQSSYAGADLIGISHYFGWYPGKPGHTIGNFDQLRPFLTQSHARYPNQALVISEFGAEGLYSGPASSKGSYAFQTDYLKKTFGVLDRLPFMNGAIYWTLREFAVNPGWTGGAQLPAGTQPDGLHHKGLIDYYGSDKPAYSVARQLFADPPAYAR